MITLIVCASVVLAIGWSALMFFLGATVSGNMVMSSAARLLKDERDRRKAAEARATSHSGMVKVFQDRINKMVARSNEQGQLIASLKKELEDLKPNAPHTL